MRVAAVFIVFLLPTAATAQFFEGKTKEQMAARRCWEKTALVLNGSSAPARFGRDDADFPPNFDPNLVPLYFGNATEYATFAKRFAGFVSSKWQKEQSTEKQHNAPFIVVKHVVGNGLPWKHVFTGKYDINFFESAQQVISSPTGLGYFRVKEWQLQYAGNELAGYKLATAYRMLNNMLGIQLRAAANNTLGDASAVGRAAPGCAGCHFKGPYPLDTIARVLNRRVGFGADVTFGPSSDGPQMLFGKMIADDAELVNALVSSSAFTFNTCRLSFEFLFGRPESTCEAPMFEACVQAFEAEGTIQAALMAMIRHPDYCR